MRAPFDGIVAEVNGEVGEYLTPSPPGIPTLPAVDLIDDSCLYVSAPIDEVDAAQLKVGMAGRITLDAYRGQHFAGKLRRIAPYVLALEKQARTVEVEVEFDSPAEARHLLVGYSADIEVVVAARDGVLRMPTAALMPGNRVLVFSPEGVLEERRVETGLANWEFTEIRSGLQAGRTGGGIAGARRREGGRARHRGSEGRGRAGQMIRLRGIERVFRVGEEEVHALRSVNLDIARGEYLSIMGPSGSGKSTLLEPDRTARSPECRALRARRARRDRPLRRRAGARAAREDRLRVPVLPPRAAADRGSRTSNCRWCSPASTRRSAARGWRSCSPSTGWRARARHRPDQLSGGQRQRVAIARAMCMRPGGAARRRAHRQPGPPHRAGGHGGARDACTTTAAPCCSSRTIRRSAGGRTGGCAWCDGAIVERRDSSMRFADMLASPGALVRGYRSRTLLILLAMGIGVAAVVAVSSLGEGARLYVANQFGSLGTEPGDRPARAQRDRRRDARRAARAHAARPDASTMRSRSKRSPAVRRLAPLIVGAARCPRRRAQPRSAGARRHATS